VAFAVWKVTDSIRVVLSQWFEIEKSGSKSIECWYYLMTRAARTRKWTGQVAFFRYFPCCESMAIINMTWKRPRNDHSRYPSKIRPITSCKHQSLPNNEFLTIWVASCMTRTCSLHVAVDKGSQELSWSVWWFVCNSVIIFSCGVVSKSIEVHKNHRALIKHVIIYMGLLIDYKY
jgi:hypothetical protein